MPFTFNPLSGTFDYYQTGGGTPGGSDTQVQFNNAGAFDGDPNFVWDNVNKCLTSEQFLTVGGTRSVSDLYAGLPAAAVFLSDGGTTWQTAYVDSTAGADYAAALAVFPDNKFGGGTVGVTSFYGGYQGEISFGIFPSDLDYTDYANAFGLYTPVNGSLLPLADDNTDFGRSSFRWRNGYFSGTVTANALTLGNQTANRVFAGPSTGSPAAPSFRALVAADIPSLSGTYLPLAGGTMTGAITSNLGSLSADTQALNITATYNNAGVTFGGVIKANVTDTASNSASLLMDLQVGGSSKFKVNKVGDITADGYTIYSAAAGILSSALAAFNVSSTSGVSLRSDAGYVALGSDAALSWTTGAANGVTRDLWVYRGGAGILDQRNSTNAQKARWFYSYTNSSNGSWAEVDTTTANTLIFGTNGNGTGASTMSKLQFNVLATNKLDYNVTTSNKWTFATGIVVADTQLMKTTTSFTNGAAAAIGTLTNAPAAGDPTKWIPIDDNGTTRYIPAW